MEKRNSNYLKKVLLSATIIGSMSLSSTSAIAETEVTNFTELQSAIVQGTTSDIRLGNNITDVSSTIGLTSANTIVNINGNNNTISPNGTGYSLFDIQANTSLNLRDAIISNASSNENGGAIKNNSGTLNIINSTFSNNTANGNVYGGAIDVQSGSVLKISGQTTFSGNKVTDGSGGAIHNLGNAVITGTDSTNLVTFDGNKAKWNGGAIFNEGTLNISNALFNQNGFVDGSTITKGGAIRNESTNNPASLTLSDTTFSSNSAENGGAIYNDSGSTLTINPNVAFNSNSAADNGGGIFNQGTATIDGASFNSNSATQKSGGAIYTTGNLTVSNSSFTGNTSIVANPDWRCGGGAIQQDSGSLTIDNSNFDRNITNSRGGAIHILRNNVTISNSTFTGNKAGSGEGGAIALTSSNAAATITNSSLTDNSSGLGGAIFNEGNLTIVADGTDSQISGNTSTQNGGAIYNRAATLNLQTQNGGSITFSGNNAAAGSDVYLDTATGPIRHSTLNILGDGTVTFNGSIAGANGNVNHTGTGSLVLNGDNSGFSGTFTQNTTSTTGAPVTTLGAGAKFFAGTSNITSGSLIWNTANDIASSATLTVDGASLTVGNGGQLTIQGNSSIDNATAVTTDGNLVLKKDMTIKSIDGSGKITADGSTLTFDSNSALGDNLNFASNNSSTATINGIADTTKADKLVSKISDGTNDNLTVNINGTNSNANVNVDGTQISNLNFSGDVSYGGEITGTGNISNTGNLTITGNQSGFNGIYTQDRNNARTIVNTSANLFGGTKNINKGFLTIYGGNIDYTDVKLGNATFNQVITGTDVKDLNTSVLEFTGVGHAGFSSGNINLSKIDNGQQNWLVFSGSNVKLADTNYQGETIYNFYNNSTIDLMEKEPNVAIKDYVFDYLVTTDDTTNLNFNIKINRDDANDRNYLTTDTLKINSGYGTFKLGNVYITGEENGRRGQYSTVNNVLLGNANFEENSTAQIAGATTSWKYSINQTDDNQSIGLKITDYTDSKTLNDMNTTDGKRFFQFTEGDTREYHIKNSLGETKGNEFYVTGDNHNVLSGILDGTTDQKGSFFHITNDVDTKLTINNVTIQDALKPGSGSVIFNDSVNSVSTVTNAIIKNNSAFGEGGAIYNGVAKADNTNNLIISNTTFDGNSAVGKGGAIYNAGNMGVSNSIFKQASDTIYMANNSSADFSGTNVINSNISSENANSTITNNGVLDLNADNSGYTGEFTQNTGVTNVTGTFFNGDSKIQSGTLNWLTQNSTSGKLTVENGSNLNIGSSTVKGDLDLGTGSSIASGANVVINTNSTLNLKDNSNVTLDSADAWGGKINLQDSATLNLNNVSNYSTAVLNAVGGNLNINNMNLNIGTNSLIDKNVSTNINSDASLSVNTGGNVTLGSTSNWSGKVLVNGGDFTVDGLTSNGIIKAGSGNVTIQNGNLTVDGNSIINDAVKLSVKPTGVLDIQGGTISISDEDNWEGTINLGTSDKGGTLNYGTTNSGTLKAESGNLNLLSNSILNIQSPSQVAQKVVVDIQNGATVNVKSGAVFNLDSLDKWNGLVTVSNGVLKTDGVDNTKIGGKLQQNSGSSIFDNKSNILLDGAENYINGGNVSVLNNSSLRLGSGVTSFALDNLNMGGNSLFSTMNNSINKYGTIDTMNVDGVNNIAIDVAPRAKTSDTFVINNLNGTNNGTLNISNFNFVGQAPIDRHIRLQVFDAENINNVNFTATDKKIFTPIGNYQMISQGGGAYTASLADYNPQVFRGQAATLAAYNHQLLINDMLTNHFILPNQRMIDKAAMANKSASISPLFAPYQSSIEDGGLWTKSYVSFEQLSMTNNLRVGNNVYGTLIGADFPAINMKKGWKFIPTAYVGYNGGNQYFNHVDMYQNGGQGGFMGTFIKNNFIGSVTAYGGGYFNEMNVAGNTDRTGNWFAGTAAKAAYNIHATKHFIIQPTAFVSYNIFGKQSWGTDYGAMSMNSGTLNGINVAPGLNLIYSRDTWSVYGTIQYMFNINDQVGGKAGNVKLPTTEMRHGYINYGVGVTKTWKDRLSSYFQINFRNGGRTGVGFQLGLKYLFDWGKPKKQTSQTTPAKAEKEVLKSAK